MSQENNAMDNNFDETGPPVEKQTLDPLFPDKQSEIEHNLAEAQQSVEKYTLNEMSAEERTQFEEHLFDCPICSDLVRQNFTVIENLKCVLKPDERAAAKPTSRSLNSGRWSEWLRLPSLVPSCAALALAGFVGYERLAGLATGNVQMAFAVPQTVTLRPVAKGDGQSDAVDHTLPEVFHLGAPQLPAGPWECELQSSEGKKLMTPIKGTKKPGDLGVEIEFIPNSLPEGHLKLVLQSYAQPNELITFPLEVH
jgi:hypothetical protein